MMSILNMDVARRGMIFDKWVHIITLNNQSFSDSSDNSFLSLSIYL